MLCLADMKKAHPSAPRQPMWDLLKRNGFSPRILAVFRRLHGEISYTVRLRSDDSGAYTLKRGLREGCRHARCTMCSRTVLSKS